MTGSYIFSNLLTIHYNLCITVESHQANCVVLNLRNAHVTVYRFRKSRSSHCIATIGVTSDYLKIVAPGC